MVLDTAQKVENKTQQPENKTKVSSKAEESPSPTKEPSPKTYTQVEWDKAQEDAKRLQETAVHNALMKAGRDWKTLELERDSLSNELKNEKERGSKFEIQLSELANENPDKFTIVKKFRELDDLEKKLKQERDEHNSRMKQERESMDTEKQKHQATIQMALSTQREIDAVAIAEEFQGGDFVQLKDLAEIMGADSKE